MQHADPLCDHAIVPGQSGRRRRSNPGTPGTPGPAPDIAAKPVNVNGYVKRTPTRPIMTVPYSFGEAAS
jgi:hypothetical protein